MEKRTNQYLDFVSCFFSNLKNSKTPRKSKKLNFYSFHSMFTTYFSNDYLKMIKKNYKIMISSRVRLT